MSVTVHLTNPIKAHGETMHELALREPLGRDLAACGAPRMVSVIGEKTLVEVDFKSVHKYISLLAGIPPSSVDQLSVPDWMAVQDAVLDFFDPTPRRSSAATETQQAPIADEGRIKIPFQNSTT